MSKLKVLIVNSTILGRDMFRRSLADVPDIDLLGTAATSDAGLQKLRQLEPDFIVFDTDTPGISPVDWTSKILDEAPGTGILLASTSDPKAAELVILALSAGAFDVIVKPSSDNADENVLTLKRLLIPRIRAFSIRRYSRLAKEKFAPAIESAEKVFEHPAIKAARRAQSLTARFIQKRKTSEYEILAIGASTGGPEALTGLIASLPRSFPLPIVAVLHMPVNFTQAMAGALDKHAALKVSEASGGELVEPTAAFLAKGGRHLLLEKSTRRRVFLASDDGPPENGCKPSVDVLFRSVASVYGSKAIGVILTGMGEDGSKGIGLLKKAGAHTIAQDEETSVVWGMPGTAFRAGYIDKVLPLDDIAGHITELVYSK